MWLFELILDRVYISWCARKWENSHCKTYQGVWCMKNNHDYKNKKSVETLDLGLYFTWLAMNWSCSMFHPFRIKKFHAEHTLLEFLVWMIISCKKHRKKKKTQRQGRKWKLRYITGHLSCVCIGWVSFMQSDAVWKYLQNAELGLLLTLFYIPGHRVCLWGWIGRELS
jgi:hypothetical protein